MSSRRGTLREKTKKGKSLFYFSLFEKRETLDTCSHVDNVRI